MFCPRCGSNQGEGKRFCTVCGTNLAAVSQALTGQIPPPNYYTPPPIPHPFEIERQKTMATGIRLTMIGGGVFAWQILSFILSGFDNSPNKFWTFIGFIFLAVGISKIVASRPTGAADSQALPPGQLYTIPQSDSQTLLSAPAASPPVPQTRELEPVSPPVTSVIDEETRHLPHREPPR